MRRFLAVLLLWGGLLGVTAVLGPHPAPALQAHTVRLVLHPMVPDGWPGFPRSVLAAADACTSATNINVPGGDVTASVNFMTVADSDPVLSCAWGIPSRTQGYRTVWYKFTAPFNGIAHVDTFFSSYDTILAVYAGSCDTLSMLACNDDTIGFTSGTAFAVSRDQTYYIEVADWQASAPSVASLSLSVVIESVASRWVFQPNMPNPRSRHALVAVGSDVYVIGGATDVAFPSTLTGNVQRLDTLTGVWTTLQAIPGGGLANTTAVYLDGKIYIPGGYNGNNTTFDSNHRTYEVATGAWGTAAGPAWPNNQPLAYATAVVHQSQFIPAGYFLIGGTHQLAAFDSPTGASATPSSTVLAYFLEQDAWSASLIPALSTARYAHTGAWVGDRVCVTGGLGVNASNQNILLTNGECYRPGSGAWTNTGNMVVPRYNAGSTVGPDGQWYVFGGVDGLGKAVETVEVYNTATNTWRALDPSYDLGNFTSIPARAWPRGAFVNQTLWVVGGNLQTTGYPVTPLVQTLQVLHRTVYLPILSNGEQATLPPNDSFATAYGLALNQAQFHNFDVILDVYDVFFFDLATTQAVTVRLSQIPLGSEYDLAVYSDNKLLWGEGINPGSQDEAVPLVLPAGRYYLFVERVYPAGPPDTQNYRLIVEG